MMTRSPQDSRAFRALLEICILVGAVAFLFVSLAARAGEDGVGTVAGTVINVSSVPVPGARVTLQGADGTAPEVTETNRQGRFFFPQLNHGYYDVRAYSNGAWSAWKHNIEVKTGKQTEVKLQIIPRKKTTD
jgi:hypothetical protein